VDLIQEPLLTALHLVNVLPRGQEEEEEGGEERGRDGGGDNMLLICS